MHTDEKFQELLVTVVQKSEIGIIITDANGFFVWANESLCDLFGYSLEDFSGKKPGEVLQGINTNSVDVQRISKGILSGKAFEAEVLNYHKNGNEIWIDLKVNPIFDDTGKISHFVGIQNDITKLKEQNRKLENFNHIVSHNLINQINNIHGLIYVSSNTKTLSDNKKYMSLLNESSNKLLETIGNLKELLSHQRNPETLKIIDIPLHNFIERVILSINHQIESSSVHLKNYVDEDLLIPSNPAYLESIIYNLLSNSIKYRDNQKQPEVKFSVSKNEQSLDIRVEDNGIGIDLPSTKNKMYQIFQTFHDNKEGESLGVGLYLVKNQVDALRGSISVQSEPGKGTIFCVTLPL